MGGKVMVAFLLVSSFVLSGYAVPQDQIPKPNVEQQLNNQYQLTRVGANGVVVQAGSVLVVQQDNIKANPAANLLYWSNLYKKDGHVKQPAIMIKEPDHRELTNPASGSSRSERRFISPDKESSNPQP